MLAPTLSLNCKKSDARRMTPVIPSLCLAAAAEEEDAPLEESAPRERLADAPPPAEEEDDTRDETDVDFPSAAPAVSARRVGYAPVDAAAEVLADVDDPAAPVAASAKASRYADSTGSYSSSANNLSRT
mmetsp:Transcript_20722/g.49786  ORF Transcript_20722/g.49786 Transcript_20722/m.49786 type:complete len:129 (-) Transcript_20722:588-974(-)